MSEASNFKHSRVKRKRATDGAAAAATLSPARLADPTTTAATAKNRETSKRAPGNGAENSTTETSAAMTFCFSARATRAAETPANSNETAQKRLKPANRWSRASVSSSRGRTARFCRAASRANSLNRIFSRKTSNLYIRFIFLSTTRPDLNIFAKQI